MYREVQVSPHNQQQPLKIHTASWATVTESCIDSLPVLTTQCWWLMSTAPKFVVLTHLLRCPGQHLHERPRLIQPSHVHAEKHHKQWMLHSLKHGGQQGIGWNSRRISHPLYCTFTLTQNKPSGFIFYFLHFFFPWGKALFWEPQCENSSKMRLRVQYLTGEKEVQARK